MRSPRIYQPLSLQANQQVPLDAPASNHVSRVLRLVVGNSLILFNGDGFEYHATISNITKHHTIVNIHQAEPKHTESPLHLHLGQAISRGEKMDFTIQKAVELGVNEITPIFSEHCNVQLSGERLEKKSLHWQAIAIHACEQCGRNKIPIVHPAKKTADWLQACAAQLKLILDPSSEISLASSLQSQKNLLQVDVLIGPEGGLSEREIEQAKYFQFQSVHLGPRILRTETVALTTISILQSYLGDMK